MNILHKAAIETYRWPSDEKWFNRPVGRALTRSSLKQEVWNSNLGPVKLDTVLPKARHPCDIFPKKLCWRAQWREHGPGQLVTHFGVMVNMMKDFWFKFIGQKWQQAVKN